MGVNTGKGLGPDVKSGHFTPVSLSTADCGVNRRSDHFRPRSRLVDALGKRHRVSPVSLPRDGTPPRLGVHPSRGLITEVENQESRGVPRVDRAWEFVSVLLRVWVSLGPAHRTSHSPTSVPDPSRRKEYGRDPEIFITNSGSTSPSLSPSPPTLTSFLFSSLLLLSWLWSL